MTTSIEQPLWAPSPERIAAANVTAFRLAAEKRWGVSLPDYAALDAWSAAGRPDVARMTLTVYPGGDGPATPPGQVEVRTEHSRILAGWSATAS